MESTAYQVKTPVFEGPLDLLLALVEKRKLFINDISLAEVTDDYIEYVNKLKEERGISMAAIADFIVVAATLILIKSKSLLPGVEITEEERENIDELEQRLEVYRMIRNVGHEISNLYGRRIIFLRQETLKADEIVFAPGELGIKDLKEMIQDILGRIPKPEKKPIAAVRKVMSLEEMIEKLVARVQNAASFSFEEFKKQSPHKDPKEQKIYAIVSFLALLELVKQGLIDVLQEKQFEDITVQALGSRR